MIGDKLRNLLKLRGMKQTELAEKIGVSKTTINSIITRNNKSVDFSTMEKIADALDVPIEYFFDRPGKSATEKPTDAGELSDSEREFVKLFSALTPANRTLFVEIAQAILKAQGAEPDQTD